MNRRGFAIVDVAVGLALAGGLVLIVTKMVDVSLKGERRATMRASLEDVRSMFRKTVGCVTTLYDNGITTANLSSTCTSTSAPGGQTAPFLRLRRRTHNNFVWMSDPLSADGSFKINGWTVRASCSDSEKTLVVRVARPTTSGFEVDPISGKSFDWSSPSSLIFGTQDSATPLCGHVIGAGPSSGLPTVTCADPDAYMNGIDLASGTTFCRPIRPAAYSFSLGSGQRLVGISQDRRGAITAHWTPAAAMTECHLVQGGHIDYTQTVTTCGAGMTAGPILGYVMP